MYDTLHDGQGKQLKVLRMQIDSISKQKTTRKTPTIICGKFDVHRWRICFNDMKCVWNLLLSSNLDNKHYVLKFMHCIEK